MSTGPPDCMKQNALSSIFWPLMKVTDLEHFFDHIFKTLPVMCPLVACWTQYFTKTRPADSIYFQKTQKLNFLDTFIGYSANFYLRRSHGCGVSPYITI